MKQILVFRTWGDENQSQGDFYVKDEGEIIFQSKCIERGWKNNEKGVSCIPVGTYPIKLEYSSRFKTNLWEIYGVPNRSECKIHSANYWHQLNGCIALGRKLLDINKDGYLDVTSSRITVSDFMKAMGSDEVAQITVSDLYD
jgi:hypothetical protein